MRWLMTYFLRIVILSLLSKYLLICFSYYGITYLSLQFYSTEPYYCYLCKLLLLTH